MKTSIKKHHFVWYPFVSHYVYVMGGLNIHSLKINILLEAE